jgi:hypothetical protein
MTLNALFYFLAVPYTLAFLRKELLTTYVNTLWAAYAVDCLLVLDMLIKLNTSFLDPASSVQVLDRRRIRQRYLSSEFIVDVSASVSPSTAVGRDFHLSDAVGLVVPDAGDGDGASGHHGAVRRGDGAGGGLPAPAQADLHPPDHPVLPPQAPEVRRAGSMGRTNAGRTDPTTPLTIFLAFQLGVSAGS